MVVVDGRQKGSRRLAAPVDTAVVVGWDRSYRLAGELGLVEPGTAAGPDPPAAESAAALGAAGAAGAAPGYSSSHSGKR